LKKENNMERLVNGGRITLRTLRATGKSCVYLMVNDPSRVNGLTCVGRKQFDTFEEARDEFRKNSLTINNIPEDYAHNQRIAIDIAKLAGHSLPEKTTEKETEKLPKGKLTQEEINKLRKLMQKW
jgi:hypothetical protein